MDVDDPYAMEICLPDPDAMDTSPNSENYTVPFLPYHPSQEFVAPQFGRLFQPFVPPPLPEPTIISPAESLTTRWPRSLLFPGLR